MNRNIRVQLSGLPNVSGVYIFKNENGKILYIGKAISIKKRVQTYFQNQPIFIPRLEKMISQIAKIDFIETKSEIEALLLEAQLIKKQKPKYNVIGKDDKRKLYIKIEKQTKKNLFPKILATRRIEGRNAKYFGPFIETKAVRKTLEFLRRIFPFRDCNNFPKKACLMYHIKRCQAPCIGNVSPKDYQKDIRRIVLFLESKQNKLIKELKFEMKDMARKKAFEQAAKLRDQIFSLEHINKITVLQREIELETNSSLFGLISILKKYYPELRPHPGFRIEAYDISNISGINGTGSMVVFIDGLKNSDQYRQFKIKTVKGMNDVACMKEVLKRRFSHKDEWILPDLIVLDGGKGQLKAVREALEEFQFSIPYVGLAKKREEIYLPGVKKPLKLPNDASALLLLREIRDEAHRFAKKYHLKLRSKKMLDRII